MLFPALARRAGLMPDRRQHLDQCRRHGGARLRQHAKPRARPRSGAADGRDLERAARPGEGQFRLRPEAALHRRGGHARHRHRGGAEALPRPRGQAVAFAGVPIPAAALKLFRHARDSGRQRAHRLRADAAHPDRIAARPSSRRARSACEPASLVRADGGLVRPRRRGCAASSSSARSRRASRRAASRDATHRRVARPGEPLLAHAPLPRAKCRSTPAGRSSTTSRSPVERVPEFIARGIAAVERGDAGHPPGAVRPSRRRQHPLQLLAARRDGREGLSRARAGDARDRACAS